MGFYDAAWHLNIRRAHQTPIFISIFVQNAHSFDSFGYACSYYTHTLTCKAQ